ncbi:MAG TPA: zinc-dependent metalloprotease [Actinomycetota bacterium]
MSDRDPGDPSSPFGDMFSEVPLFREIQRVLMSGSGPVNWELARQVGIATATMGAEDPPPAEDDRKGLAETVRAAELAVADFTLLPMPGDLAEVQAFRRAQWIEANIRGLRDMIDPIASKLAAALGQLSGAAGPEPGGGFGFQPPSASPSLPGMDSPPGEEGPDQEAFLRQMMGSIGPLLMGVQVGTALGALGQRVLGQFDLAVPRPDGAMYFVVPNIAAFEHEWELPTKEFRAYVAVHEVAHRFEFARPWAREHFLSLVRDLVEHADVDLSGLQQRMEGLDVSNPEALSDAFDGLGNLFGEAATGEQRLRVARVQAFLSAAEGYADHVVEGVGGRMLPSFSRIKEAMRRYHEGRPADQALERLLGLEMKLEQYRLGAAFCERVASDTDEATLSRMWGSAESLPSMPELEEPTLWLSRMA